MIWVWIYLLVLSGGTLGNILQSQARRCRSRRPQGGESPRPLSLGTLSIRLSENRNRICHTIQSSPCLWSDNTVGNKAMSPLESAHGGLCFGSEVAVYNNSDFRLHLLHSLVS